MRELSPAGKRINSGIGKAIIDHKMIEDGDKILVAVSGGKDSLTLLYFLKEIQKWAPVKYEITAAHVNTDLNCADVKKLEEHFKSMDVKFVFKEANVGDEDKRTNCFWCSWTRRKVLFELADELGCAKIAFGHHKDDIVETILLNMIYKGEIAAMNPRQEMFGGKITIIRPLCLVEEKRIKDFAKEQGFSVQTCNCPFGEESKRKYIKTLIKKLSEDNPKINIKTNIYSSVSRIKTEYVQLKDAGSEEEE